MADGEVRIDVTADDSDIKKKLGNVEELAEDAGDGLEKLGDSAEDAGKGFKAADVAIGSFVGNSLTNLANKVVETVGNIAALADETREYREDMAKLDTAFTTAGHSTDTANAAYKDFYAILGESDRSIEAVNHLAALTKNEEELAKWGDIAAGVTARFGDSLPIEGLTEAANETAKVGAVTGPLADALNWAGISEDKFNEQLAKCNSEQERATLITNTLNKEYEAAAAEYNELTASTQEARLATASMEEAQAALGAAIEPVTTAWTNMKANALQWLVDEGLPALKNGWQWVLDNIPTIAVVVAGLTAAWLAFGGAQKIASAITTAYTAAQAALNAVMNANPIGLIILAITALVAAFVYLWNNCESFRNFWIGLWEIIKNAAKAVADWFKNAWSATIEWLKGAVAKIKDFFADAWTGIKKAFSNSIIGAYFRTIWENIKAIFSVVKAVLTGNWSDAWNGIKAIWSNTKQFFVEVWEKIKNAFKISDMLKIGKDLLVGLWNGISDKIAWLKSKVTGVVDTIKSWFTGKDGFDEHSPSKWSEEVFVNVNKGSAKGLEKSAGIPLEAARATTDRIKTAVSLENARYASMTGTADTGFTELARAVGVQTAATNSLANDYRTGAGRSSTVVIELNGRELGRAVVDTGNAENTRYGTKLVTGGAL